MRRARSLLLYLLARLALAPVIAERAASLLCTDPDRLWSSGVGAGMAQLGHGELYSRLFRS